MSTKTIDDRPGKRQELPAFDEAYQDQYPHAHVAFAIAELRGRLGLTQAELGRRIGAPQSVIARLESGKHGIGVALLNRIAEGLGTQWRPAFAIADEDSPSAAATLTTGSGDPLLDAFNIANTSGDYEAARRHALRISRAARTPRRMLALAIDAFNRGRYQLSLKWSEASLAGDLPTDAASVARVVAARSHMALGRADNALRALGDTDQSASVQAAKVEALLETHQADTAIHVVEELLRAPAEERGAGTEFLAARAYLRGGCLEDALVHIGVFRWLKPSDRAGQLIHGAILGAIGDSNGDTSKYGQALALFEPAMNDDDPDGIRLFAMTAARLGRWRDALSQASRLLDIGDKRSANAARYIAADSFERLDDPNDLEGAARLAEKLTLADRAAIRSQLAFAHALRGDFGNAVTALGLTPRRLTEASPEDQIRCASAFLVKGTLEAAFPILWRNEGALSVPDGQLFLARAALAARNTTVAAQALRRVADCEEPAAETAQVALDLVEAIQHKGASSVLEDVHWVTLEPTVGRLLIEMKRWPTSLSAHGLRFENGQIEDAPGDVFQYLSPAAAADGVLAN